MTTYNNNSLNNLQTSADPAFVSNERLRRSQKGGAQKNLKDCCYSLSNIALIAACIVAIIFTSKFLSDDPLYEVGDYLLGLRFYRQLIYVIVILPLALLVPLFNAASAFFLSSNYKQEIGKSLLLVKIIYQVLMVILVFIALAFVAPSIRESSVATQIDHEIRKHMYRLYDNQFSQEFLNQIQETYECCDEQYYRSNFNEKLPLSCYRRDGFLSNIFEYTCAEIIGNIVSTRCMIIAACLIIILVSLASLIAMNIIELVTFSGSSYELGPYKQTPNDIPAVNNVNASQSTQSGNISDEDDDILVDNISNRLKISERERDTPLLPKFSPQTSPIKKAYSDIREPILTRANYLANNRPQSPIFISSSGQQLNRNESSSSLAPSIPGSSLTPTKSVLKKSTSFLKIDDDQDEEDNQVENYQKQLQRELQTRRSLLNSTTTNIAASTTTTFCSYSLLADKRMLVSRFLTQVSLSDTSCLGIGYKFTYDDDDDSSIS